MRLNKQVFQNALSKIEQGFGCDMAYYGLNEERDALQYLIDAHFASELTASECDILISLLKPIEDELGMDITLLINKLNILKSMMPEDNTVVECVWMDDED